MTTKTASDQELWQTLVGILKAMPQDGLSETIIQELENKISRLASDSLLAQIQARLKMNRNFVTAIHNINTELMNRALVAWKETLPYAMDWKESPTGFQELLRRQNAFAAFSIISEIDNSTLTMALIQLAPSLLANFHFDNKEFVNAEMKAMTALGFSEAKVLGAINFAEKHRRESIEKFKEIISGPKPLYVEKWFMASRCCPGYDPGKTALHLGDRDAATELAVINYELMELPEVGQAIAALSLLAALIMCL